MTAHCFSSGRCPPLYPICCCAPAPIEHVCCEPLFTRANRIRLDRCKTAGVTLTLAGCAPTDVALRLRRRGDPRGAWLLRYPALYQDQSGAFVFRFDDKIYALPPGRYEAQVLVGDKPCGCVEIETPRDCLGVVATTPLLYHGLDDPEAPAEIGDVFDCLLNFSAALCRQLGPGEQLLPLTADGFDALCACHPCRPVELVLDDGVRRETVEFRGCVNGVAPVRRGVAGTTSLAFPKGTTVKFVWTPNNVAAACEGCP